jgi:hypothetical protein
MMVEVGVLAHAAAHSAGRRLAHDHVAHCHLQSTVSAIIANGNGLAGGSKAGRTEGGPSGESSGGPDRLCRAASLPAISMNIF